MDDDDHDRQRRHVIARRTACLGYEDVPLMPNLDEIWVPRIGADATAELRRNARVGTIMVVTVLAMGIASSFAFGRGTPGGVLLGCVEVAIGIVAFALLIRSRMRLAEAISQWFGIKIGSRELPNMNAKQFDAWCQRRHLRSPRQQQL